MAKLTLELSGLDQLQKMQAFLAPETFAKAERGAVSYAAKSVPPVVAKGIGASYYIKAGRIKQDISGVRIDPGGTSATIKFSRRPPTLIQFGAKPGKRGSQPGLGRGLGWGPAKPAGKPLTATILRSDGRKARPGAFIATGQSGNQVVLQRRTSGALVGVYGPSIGSIFLGKSRIADQLRMAVQARINEQFVTGFQRALDKASKGYGGK
jgi:hypothetical protein